MFVTVNELALALNLSVKSIRRAYGKVEIPIIHDTFRQHIAEALERRTAAGRCRRVRSQAPGW